MTTLSVTFAILLSVLEAQAPTSCRIEPARCQELLQPPEAEERILDYLSEHPEDDEARIVRVLVLLTSGELVAARNELDRIQFATGPGAADPQCSAFLNEQIDQQARLARDKAKFAEALRTRNPDRLRASIENLEAPEPHKAVLRVYANVFDARFDVALTRWNASTIPRSEEHGEHLLRMVIESRQAYEKYRLWISFAAWSSRGKTHGYLIEERPFVPQGLSPQATSLAPADLRLIASSRLAAFIEAVTELQRIAPMDDLAVSALALRSFLFLPYEELEAFADEILDGRDVLRLPFDTEHGTMSLEINLLEKRLRTVSVGLPVFREPKRDDWLPTRQDFDLSFAEIEKISQSFEFVRVSTRYTREEYAVKTTRRGVFVDLEPEGRIGTMALFNDFTQIFGEAAAQQVMHNFGMYMLHLIDNEEVTKRSQYRLAESEKRGGFWLNLARIATGQRVDVRLADDFEKQVEAAQNQGAEDVAGWHDHLTDRAFELIDRTYLAPITDLLQCPPP